MQSESTPEKTLFTAVVKTKNEDGTVRKETAEVVSISHYGAGFYLGWECKPGHLVSLLMAMPHNFRRYDYDKKLYKIWGLVQHSNLTSSNGRKRHHIGVAFVGKSPPSIHNDNPRLSYRVCGICDDGFWKIEPIDSNFQIRREPRFWKPVDVSIFELNQSDATVRNEKTVAENISESGASVVSFLNVNVGDRVRFYCHRFNFSAYALVRNRQDGTDDRPHLNLEFIDHRFPVTKLDGYSDK